MKILNIYFIVDGTVISRLSFTACSDDDDDPVRFKVLNPELTFLKEWEAHRLSLYNLRSQLLPLLRVLTS